MRAKPPQLKTAINPFAVLRHRLYFPRRLLTKRDPSLAQIPVEASNDEELAATQFGLARYPICEAHDPSELAINLGSPRRASFSSGQWACWA